MKYMDSEQQGKCHAIIHSASAAAAGVGAGLAQLPCSDSLVIVPIQVTMTIGLGRVFGIELTESAAKAAVVAGTGTTVGRMLSQVLIGWIPGVGNGINAATAASVTETLGWMLAKDFARQAAYASNVLESG